MSNTDLALRPEVATTLFAGATPAEVIAAATEAADELHSVIEQRHLYTRIGSSEHVRVEGWQTIGVMTGVFAVEAGGVIELPWPVIVGAGLPGPPEPGREPRRAAAEWPAWRAAADAYDAWRDAQALIHARDSGLAFGFKVAYRAVKDGREVGWGEGRCTRAESNWRTRDDYALASMAQTRGQSRALRQPLGFVVSLAGYATTPAEEVGDGGAGVDQPAPPPDAVAVFDEEATAETAGDLQRIWPNFDAHGFMRVLARRFGGGVPEAAGVALRAWAWWAGRTPESELPVPQEPPEAVTDTPNEEATP